ncbi:winged helix-turn-helix transcriptional regulator [Teichococcus vastitatis]|uniref:Helix-turn-helix transcriptional regulator n=1 Tax=Teichococcus vastitatis TaxID=2307076 RepID=A0ABS9W7R5_9PROT|nr:helix-turn-helix domain-containing protein [Pseudoroseomonas vastitatis]MCI0755326.1 helix-turn-helix transcriptional regulator [Pseudoroseomonas vastitatis]
MPKRAVSTPIGDIHDDLCETMPQSDQALIRDVLARVVDRWSLWALSELTEDGPLRFSRLLERIDGVSQKSLTATLRELERDGFITRTVTAQVPIRVDYAATPLGHALIERVHPLWLWAAENLEAFTVARTTYDQAKAAKMT